MLCYADIYVKIQLKIQTEAIPAIPDLRLHINNIEEGISLNIRDFRDNTVME